MRSLILFWIFLILSPRTFASGIVYGFSSVMLPNETQEFVYRGFILALKTYKGIDTDKDLRLIHSGSNSLTSPVETAREVLKAEPRIITGFPSSLESQLAAPVLKESGILTVFASSSNTNLGDMAANIYSTSEDVFKTNELIASEILKTHPGAKGAVIYNPFDYFSVNQKKIWEVIRSKINNIDFILIPTNADGNLTQAQLEECKGLRYIISTLFPNKSYNVFRNLFESKIDPTVYTNSSWYKIDYNILMRFILKKKAPVFVVQLKNFDLKILSEVSKKYKAIYKGNPPFEVLIGYDLGIVVGKVFEEAKKKNADPLLIIKRIDCFLGSPLGKICFKKTGGFAPREIKLVNINERK